MFGKTKTPKKDTGEIFNIPPYLIKPNPELSRTEFFDMSLCSLADSISRFGILQPLTVRLSEKGKYELVAGERRLRAAVMLKLPTVPCVLLPESESYEYLSVIENIQREKLGLFDEARAVKRLLARNAGDISRTAELLSVSEKELASKVKLCKYSRAEMQALTRLSIGEKTAVMLLDIPSDIRFYAIKLSAENNLSEESVANLCSIIRDKKSPSREDLERAVESIVYDNDKNEKEVKKEDFKKSEKNKTKVLLRDLRLFENSLEKSVELLKTANFKTELDISSEGDEKVYTIRVSRTVSD